MKQQVIQTKGQHDIKQVVNVKQSQFGDVKYIA